MRDKADERGKADQIRDMCFAAGCPSRAEDFIQRGVAVQAVARELTDAAAAEAEALERETYPVLAGRSLSDAQRRARGLPEHPWTAGARDARERHGRAGDEAATQALGAQFDTTVATLVATKAASTRDVAARMVLRAHRIGVFMDCMERMATIARDLRRATGLEIEGDDGAVCAALQVPSPVAVDPRRRGRPRKAGFTARVVALERVIRAHGGGTRVHRLAASVFEYFGPLALDWMREELSPLAHELAPLAHEFPALAPFLAHAWTPAAILLAVQDAWDNHVRRDPREGHERRVARKNP